MKKFILSFIILFCFIVNAQEIPSSTSRTIEPVPSGTNTSGSLLFPKNTEKRKTYVRPSETPTIDLTQQTDLLDPGVRFKGQKFTKDYAGPNFKSDTFLGEIRTGKQQLEMVCRDHMFQDGDKVRVWIDDKIVISEIYLTNLFQGFHINLKPGFNKIEIEALNQGSSGPNTAQFKVMDMDGKVLSENVWNLNAGVKATLIVIKE